LKLYKSLGGETITLGSDAHLAEDIGKGIKEGMELAQTAGFRYIATFTKRKAQWHSI
jgi:histidinol-phosphatase (PHP family)